MFAFVEEKEEEKKEIEVETPVETQDIEEYHDTSNFIEKICYFIEVVYTYVKPSLVLVINWFHENFKVKSE